MTTNKTEIIIVLDRSGSMQIIKDDIEGGFKTFLAEQKKLPGVCNVSLYQFDDVYEEVYTGVPIANLAEIKVVPRNGTALVDAVCKTIDSVGRRLAAMPEKDRPAQIDFMILSDGAENASREFDRAQMAEKVKHQTEKYSWKFTFMGCNQDAIAAGTSYNISASNSLTYANNSKGITGAFMAKSAGTSYLRSSVDLTSNYSYSASDRAAAAGLDVIP